MLIFFPPRLLNASDSIEDPSDAIDDAVRQYFDKSVCILIDEESLKDAMKVIEFAEAFKDLVRPPGETR